MSTMQDKISKMREAGYSEAEISGALKPYKDKMSEAGYSQLEINEAFGKPEFDDKELKDFANNVGSDVPEEAEGLIENFQAGAQASASGMIARGKMPSLNVGEDASMGERLASTVGGIVADIPFIVGGAVAGMSGGPITSVAGAFALPAGARKIMVDGFENGSIDSPGEFLNRLAGATAETTKGYITGLATAAGGIAGGAASKAVGKTVGTLAPNVLKMTYGAQTATALTALTKVGGEAAGMSLAAASFEGRLPTSQEFIDATVLFGLGKATPVASKAIAKRVKGAFIRTGKTPVDLTRDMQTDGTIREDIVSGKDVPRAYTELAKESDIGLSPKQKADTPEGRIEAQISREAEKLKQPFSLDNAYTQLVDKTNPINILTKLVTQGKKLPADVDPYIGVRLYAGTQGKINHFLEMGTFNPKTLKVDGPGLKQILEPLKGDTAAYEQYSLAKRTLEVNKNGIETGIKPEDALSVVSKSDAKFKEIFDQNRKFRERTLNYLSESGVLSKESKDVLDNLSKDYVPLHRDFKIEETGKLEVKEAGSVSGNTSIYNPIKKLKGSERKIISPIENDIKNSYAFINLAEKNIAIGKMIALKDLPGGEKYIVEKNLTKKERESSLKDVVEDAKDTPDMFKQRFTSPRKDEVVWFDNGRARVFKVDKQVADVYNGLNTGNRNILTKMLKPVASALRAGITLSPAFMIKNLLRDNITAGIQSKSNFIPFLDGMKGFSSIVKKDSHYSEWLRSGGANAALVSMDRAYLKDSMFRILQDGKRNSPQTAFEKLRVAAEISDSASRIGEFRKALQKEGNSPAGMMEAAFRSREVSMDFARIGASIESWNQITAFANAKIGGLDRFTRAMKENPVGTGAKVAGYIMLPSALAWYAIHDDPDYKKLPQWRKDMFMHFKTGGKLIAVPRPFEPGILFGGGMDRMLEFIHKDDDSKTIQDSFRGLVDNSGLTEIMGIAIPTAVAPFLANHTNTNLHTGAPLVPADRENLLPEYKYTHGTTELTKYISKLSLAFTPDSAKVDVKQRTPIGIDNIIRSITGGAGPILMQTVDYGLRKAGILPDPIKPTKDLTDSIFIKSFIVRNPGMTTSNMEEFFESYRTNEMFIKTFKKLSTQESKPEEAVALMETRMQYFQSLSSHKKAIGDIISQVKYIEFLEEGMSSEEKRQSIDTLYSMANAIAESANEESKEWKKIIKNQSK